LPGSAIRPNSQSEVENAPPTNEASSRKRQASASPTDHQSGDSEPQDDHENEAADTRRTKRKKRQVQYTDDMTDGSEDEADVMDLDDPAAATEVSIEELDFEADEDIAGEGNATDDKTCKCDSGVSKKFKDMVKMGAPDKKQRVLITMAKRLEAAGMFKAYRDDSLFICAMHTKATATSVGLKTRKTVEQMGFRIRTMAESRNDIGGLMTGDTYHWWSLAVRPPHPAEIRGVFKYDVADDPAKDTDWQPAVGAIFDDLKARYNMDVKATYEETGNVHVPAFAWWFETVVGYFEDKPVTIADLAYKEFDMYLWHFRSESGNAGSLGWLRNCYYSGIQQLMRQDPEYYRLYVALRPDHFWRLMTHPYYAKYAREGDSTFFRHIDMNITQFLHDGRAGNMIQGSVSLDDEKDDCCTEILVGLHTREKLKEWYERVASRAKGNKKVLDAFVNRIQDKEVWSQADIEHFQTDFEPMPCKKGDARITSPFLPHGSTETPKGAVRRTLLPWFMAIQSDHTTMETIEMGS